MSKRCRIRECPLFGKREVPYGGNTKGRIVGCGESPGYNEERDGKPFIGDAGGLIKRVVRDAGLNWAALFIMNSARCRIIKKEMANKEITATLFHCRRYVEAALHQLKPKCIVLWGDFALKQVMKRSGITKARGRWLWSKEFDCWVMPTFHPAYILRNQSMEQFLLRDMKQVADFARNGYKPLELDEDVTYIDVADLRDVINEGSYVSLDTEDQGLDTYDPNFVMLSVSVSAKEGTAYNVNLYEEAPVDEADFIIQWPRLIEGSRKRALTEVGVKKCDNFDKKVAGLKWLLENPKVKIAMMHGNFDLHALSAFFKRIKKPWALNNYVLDIQAAANVLDENLYKLASLVDLQNMFTNYRSDYNQKFDIAYDKADMLTVPLKARSYYANQDADVTRRAAMAIKKQLLGFPKLALYYAKVVHPSLVHTLFALEKNGAWIDKKTLPKTTAAVAEMIRGELTDCLKLTPQKVKDRDLHQKKGLKLTRSDFVRDALFSKEGFNLPVIKETKGHEPSIDKKVRKELAERRMSIKARQFLGHYDQWSELHTLWSRYLRGFGKHIKIVDGRVHSSYSLATTVTGRVACLTGDTRISVLDERGRIPISDIQVGDWVWAFNDKLEPIPVQVSMAARTGKKTKIVKISFMTQGKREIKTIRCTPKHLFRLRNGEYKKAEDLEEGDRVLAIERAIGRGYRRLWATGHKEIPEHRLVWKALYGKPKGNIHHNDKVKTNNVPGNLEDLSPLDHSLCHPWNDRRTAKLKDTLSKKTLIIRRCHKKENRPGYYELKKEWCLEVLMANKGKPTAFRDIYHMDYQKTISELNRLEIDWMKVKDRFRIDGSYITDDALQKARELPNFHQARLSLRVGWPKAKRLLVGDFNHTISKVERIDDREDVYDITIPIHHNFIANGVCVHNSSSPNMQNNPKRSKSAKYVRQLISAPKGWLLMMVDESQAELRWAAHLSNAKSMIKVFKENGDIHTNTAKSMVAMTGELWDKISKNAQAKMRLNAKPLNFGMLYLMSAPGLSSYAKYEYGAIMSADEAQEYIDVWFNTYPEIRRYHKNMIEFCRRYQYVESPLGRRRRLPEINSSDKWLKMEAERQAVNHPIQSPSSDIVLMACNELERKEILNPEEILPVLFIHDELVFQVRENADIKYYARAVVKEMENPPLRELGVSLRVPLVADVKIGPNLDQAKKLKL